MNAPGVQAIARLHYTAARRCRTMRRLPLVASVLRGDEPGRGSLRKGGKGRGVVEAHCDLVSGD